MKIALYTCILPRLEVPFLEEWVQHHLQLGVDHIYIYDNGYVIEKIDETPDALCLRDKDNIHSIVNTKIQWTKKPDADYFLEYTDHELQEIVQEITDKYKNNVEVVPWQYDQHGLSHPYSQVHGFKHCISNSEKIKWWLHIDPDEYIILHKHNSLESLIKANSPVGKLLFKQRVFQKRDPGKSVRELTKWAYDIDLPKSLVCNPNPGNGFRAGIHDIPSMSSRKTVQVPYHTGMLNHYRGHPLHGGGRRHLKFLEQRGNIIFDKTDSRMSKYL